MHILTKFNDDDRNYVDLPLWLPVALSLLEDWESAHSYLALACHVSLAQLAIPESFPVFSVLFPQGCNWVLIFPVSSFQFYNMLPLFIIVSMKLFFVMLLDLLAHLQPQWAFLPPKNSSCKSLKHKFSLRGTKMGCPLLLQKCTLYLKVGLVQGWFPLENVW